MTTSSDLRALSTSKLLILRILCQVRPLSSDSWTAVSANQIW
jgi:hypothetical protein